MEIKTTDEITRFSDSEYLKNMNIKWVRVDDIVPKIIKVYDVYDKLKEYSINLTIKEYNELSQSSPERTSRTLSVSEANLDNSTSKSGQEKLNKIINNICVDCHFPKDSCQCNDDIWKYTNK